MDAAASAVDLALVLGLALLATLSLNLVVLTGARLLLPDRPLRREARAEDAGLPEVLVQLPLYNEGDLVERVLAAVAALDWPRERLHIQVLDDSTDDSVLISREAVRRLAALGFRIELLHRTRRTAFKAGALAAGLERSNAPFVAIFDADFIPPPDFLRRTLGVLLAEPGLALVQARWTHLNPDDNLLTRVQARLLDGHFRVEQIARSRLGLPVPFNGTCGVWRRAAIQDAGGWQGDTLTEDLDLSLRAHLRGWRSGYLADLAVPGALPTSPRAWRSQQFRWTKGFVQCLLKLLPAVWGSERLAPWQKLMVTLQLGQPLAFLIGVTCLLMGLPFIAGAASAGPVLTAVALSASALGFLGTAGFLAVGAGQPLTRRTAGDILAALLLTSGLLLSNARAGLEALLRHRSEFVRTPKSALAAAVRSGPRLPRCGLPEVAAGVSLLGFALAEEPATVPYLAVVISGLVGFGFMQLMDGRRLAKAVVRSGR